MREGKKNLYHSTTLIKYLGFAFIFLSIFRFIGTITLDPKYLLGITLSGLFFITFDFFEFQFEKVYKTNFKRKYFFIFMRDLSLCFATYSLIIVPFLTSLNLIQKETLNKINEGVVLFGIGLVIMMVGLRTDRKTSEVFDKYQGIIDKYQEYSEESKNMIFRVIDERDELMETVIETIASLQKQFKNIDIKINDAQLEVDYLKEQKKEDGAPTD